MAARWRRLELGSFYTAGNASAMEIFGMVGADGGGRTRTAALRRRPAGFPGEHCMLSQIADYRSERQRKRRGARE